jgi:hypothetical protein
MAHHRNIERRRQGNITPQKANNLIEDTVENEEKEHLLLTPVE